MLTIKSNFSNFKDKQGNSYTTDELANLSKAVIKTDIINFNLNKVGGGFTDKVANKVIIKLTLGKEKIIVVINDITLQMANKLLEAGYKNIYLAFGRWNKNGTPNKDKIVYNIMKAFIKNNIKEKLNVISLEEIFNMKIDGVICNPPYGAIGANIAYTIREKIDYEYFANLLPANDYKRNKTKDLFNYQSEMETINDGFDDAAVTTHLALINKDKVNDLTIEEFIRSRFTDKILDKYFVQTAARKHYAIDSARRPQFNSITTEDNTNTILFGIRDMNHQHLSYDKNGDTYLWNVLKAINIEKLKANIGLTGSKNQQASHYFMTFKTATEKNNFADFMYSKNGFRFLGKVFKALNIDSMIALGFFLPKVDWTRSWTVEEILRDYGYTEEEIAEIMADLDNFKGMDD